MLLINCVSVEHSTRFWWQVSYDNVDPPPNWGPQNLFSLENVPYFHNDLEIQGSLFAPEIEYPFIKMETPVHFTLCLDRLAIMKTSFCIHILTQRFAVFMHTSFWTIASVLHISMQASVAFIVVLMCNYSKITRLKTFLLSFRLLGEWCNGSASSKIMLTMSYAA